MRFFVCYFLLLLMTGCDNTESAMENAMPSNSAGYPIVSGVYSFVSHDFNSACSINRNQKISLFLRVEQNGRSLKLKNKSVDSVPGIKKYKTSDALGSVEGDLQFTVEEIAAAEMKGMGKNVQVIYSIGGSFSNTGWQGVYVYTVKNRMGLCTYTALFKGEKQPTQTKNLDVQKNVSFLRFDTVGPNDMLSKIAASLATK